MESKDQLELPLLGKLPHHWRTVEFSSVLKEGTRNGIYKQKEFHGFGDKIVNMGELFAHPRLFSVPMKRVKLSELEESKFRLEVGDLLFARRSLVAEGAGKCSIVCEIKEPTTFESSIIRARPNSKIADSFYLYYLFNSPYGTYILDTIRRQVAVSGITGTDLVKLSIPLPPLPEQKAIAHILGTLDDKIELNQKMNQTLEAMVKAIFKSWFVDFDPVKAKIEGRQPIGMDTATAELFPDSFEESSLGLIPKGWGFEKLSKVTSYLQRGIQPKYIDEDGVLVLNQRCIRDYRINVSNARRHDTNKKLINERELKIGDVLINSTGVGTLGRVAQVLTLEETTIVDSHVTIIRANSNFLTWNALGLSIYSRQPEIEELGEGSTGQTELSRTRLGALEILIPPLAIQSFFDGQVLNLRRKTILNDIQSRTLTNIRDTLLPKLMSGEIRVKEAEKLMEAVA